MTTIDKLDVGIYVQYARRTSMLEQIHQEYHLDEAGSVPAQIQMLNLSPTLAEMERLLGVLRVQNPWAFFLPPTEFRYQRRSPFGFFRVAPSLGSFEEEEENERELEEMVCETEEDEKEKKILKNCFAQIKMINGWVGFIVGRVGQFLQG